MMNYEKIAAPLIVAWQNLSRKGEAAVLHSLRTLGIVPSEGRPRPLKSVVFVHCERQANLDYLARTAAPIADLAPGAPIGWRCPAHHHSITAEGSGPRRSGRARIATRAPIDPRLPRRSPPGCYDPGDTGPVIPVCLR